MAPVSGPDSRYVSLSRDEVRLDADAAAGKRARSIGTPAIALACLAVAALAAFPELMRATMPAAALWTSVGLGAALVALSVIDFETQRLPDYLTLPLLAAGLAATWAFGWGGLDWRALSAMIGFAAIAGADIAYRALRGRSGIGLGDAKLMAAAGAWLGAELLPTVLLLACAAALVGVLFARLTGKVLAAATRIAFGPFIARRPP